MIDFLCNCGKTVSQVLLEDLSAGIEIQYKASEEIDELLDNNDNDKSMSQMNFLYKEAKPNLL